MIRSVVEHACVLLLGAGLGWVSIVHPAEAPAWAPWDYNALQYACVALPLLWYWRGVARSQPRDRPSVAQRVAFTAGAAAIYIVLQTRFEYYAQHMFFLTRLQHSVLHHAGPFLFALSWPGATILRGMPSPLRRVLAPRALLTRVVRWPLRVLQHWALAPVLFLGLLFTWLIPPMAFRAMLDPTLYDVMSWSMLLDGLLFWFLVLDPRPSPYAPLGYLSRLALGFLVIFPQIAVGTLLGNAATDLYPFYNVCGRLFASIGPLQDQAIGGLVLWIPASMMSALAAVIILARFFREQDRAATLPARGVALLLGALFLVVAPAAYAADPDAASVAGIAPRLRLSMIRARDAQPVTEADLRGQIVLLFFGYTSCPDICPLTLANVAQLLDRLGPAASRVTPLFVTVDPARDTLPVLRDYTAAFSPRIEALRGSPDDIAWLARRYRVFYSVTPATASQPEQVAHSGATYVFGPDGRAQWLLPSLASGAGIDAAMADLRPLLNAP